MEPSEGKEFDRLFFCLKILLLSFTMVIFLPFIYIISTANPDFGVRVHQLVDRLVEEAESLGIYIE